MQPLHSCVPRDLTGDVWAMTCEQLTPPDDDDDAPAARPGKEEGGGARVRAMAASGATWIAAIVVLVLLVLLTLLGRLLIARAADCGCAPRAHRKTGATPPRTPPPGPRPSGMWPSS